MTLLHREDLYITTELRELSPDGKPHSLTPHDKQIISSESDVCSSVIPRTVLEENLKI